MKLKCPGTATSLTHREPVRVRFSDVDQLGIVWHGRYLDYLADAREGFGKRYGLGVEFFAEHGLALPVVGLEINYLHALHYHEEAYVEVTYRSVSSAKHIYSYELVLAKSSRVALRAYTVQVFYDMGSRGLLLTEPECIRAWRRQRGV